MIWFTSDLHYNHANIIKFTAARHQFLECLPFPVTSPKWTALTPEEQRNLLKIHCVPTMNGVLIKNFNDCVKPDDEVYILGDLCFGNEAEALLKKLNGKKHLIIGNHDKRYLKKVYKENASLVWTRDVYNLKFICPMTHQPQMAVLSHYPYAIWENCHHGTWCLHGHSHGSYKREDGKILDVGVDSHHLKPWSLLEVAQYMSTRVFKKLDHHDEDTNP